MLKYFTTGVLTFLCLNALPAQINPASVGWLDSATYFFGTPEDSAKYQVVWKHGAGKNELLAIVNDTMQPFKPRFLAAEILFGMLPGFPEGANTKVLGQLYAQSMIENVGSGDDWGRPFERHEYGSYGLHLLRIGSDAVPALSGLLNNNHKIYYGGSDKNWERPASYQLRIKDFAAFYICRIKGWMYHCPKSQSKRDRKINRLKRKLHVQ